MNNFRSCLLGLLGKPVRIKCNFDYLLCNAGEPTIFTCEDYRTVMDYYQSYAYSITIIEPSSENELHVISIRRY